MNTAAAQLTDVYVPGACIGQVVTVEGVDYRVTEINLARHAHPVLVPAGPAEEAPHGQH